MDRQELHIVVDAREKLPFDFTGASIYEGTTVEAGTLATGDYSVKGLESAVACERKSLPDLIQCLSGSRERFVRELERARGLEAFCVVVEAPWEALAKGQYRSQLAPLAATQSIASFMSRLQIPFWFCGSRAAAEFCTWSFLRQFAEGQRQKLKAVEQALGLRPARRRAGPDSSPAREA